MPYRNHPSSPGRQGGVGLIEVLIAVLVMAIGLLGIAALQATALRNSQSSMERSQATVHSYAILDAMRANLDSARAGNYDMDMTCDAPELPEEPSLGETDKAAWVASLHSDLGETSCGKVECVAASEGDAMDCTVTVQWNDSRGSGGEEEQTMVTTVRI